MTESVFTPQAIADFLKENPHFLVEHADIFSEVRIPNPDGPGVLSLLEYQVKTLRQQLQNSHQNLQDLGLIAYENQDINDTITDWCASLLAQKEDELIPAAIVTGLQDAFPELEVELLLWGLENLEDYQLEDNKEVQHYIQSLQKPYTGKSIHPGLSAWLSEPAASIAVVPLHVNDQTVGALIFASKNAEHFYEGMGVIFLETLSYLASAAISRIAPIVMDDTPIEIEEVCEAGDDAPLATEDASHSSENTHAEPNLQDDYPVLEPTDEPSFSSKDSPIINDTDPTISDDYPQLDPAK